MSEPSAASPDRPPRQGLALLAALTFFWGVNWPAMKLALADLDPWTFRALCIVAGAVGLLGIARARGLALAIPRADAVPLALAALANVTGWQLFSGFGLTMVEAGRASIVAYTMPIIASVLGVLVLGERMTWHRAAGLLLGAAGIALLVAPNARAFLDAPWGLALMLLAATSWAIGTVINKAVRWRLDSLRLAGWQIAIGGLPVVLGAPFFGRPESVLEIGPSAALGLLYAMLIPMIYCHWAWFRLIALFPASVAAISTLGIPVVGVFSSALVLGEPTGAAELGALALVVAALALVLIVPGGVRSRSPRPAAPPAAPVSGASAAPPGRRAG